MSPQIDIDQEVLDLLKSHAEPFADTPNSVLRRLLGLQEPSPDRMASATSTDAELEPSARATRGRKSRRTGARAPRAPRGSLLPETEYELPILDALASQPGGRAPAREVLQAIGPVLADKLTDLDLKPINSGNIRWHNRAQFARLNLVRGGQLAADSPRGIWEITDAGRERLATSHKG